MQAIIEHAKMNQEVSTAMKVSSIILLMSLVFVLNLPFGYWRASAVKYSRDWILAVHIPVPVIIVLRFIMSMGWPVLPFSLVAFFLGQYAGGKLHRMTSRRMSSTACLVIDLWRLSLASTQD